MIATLWTRWLRGLLNRHAHGTLRARPDVRCRPRLEALEDRAMPSTFTVINTNDSGVGSLRAALISANDTATSPGLDTIAFNIPGTGVKTITLATNLPTITDPIIIDGYTQLGASANTVAVGDNAVLKIQIDASMISQGFSTGFTILKDTTIDTGGAGSTIRGMVINGGFDGVEILASNNVVEGCFFNTNATGDTVFTRPDGQLGGDGVAVLAGNGNRIGGTAPAARNVIVAGSECVRIGNLNERPANTVVQGNYIGTNAQGTAALSGRGFVGVNVRPSVNTLIGGLTGTPGTGAGNLISGNGLSANGGFAGISIDQSFVGSVTVDPVTIQGNLIGTNATGTAAIPNPRFGIVVNGLRANVLIGGPQAGAANVISGNGTLSFADGGISVSSSGSQVTVQNNLIGVALDGVTPLPNIGDGIITQSPATSPTIIGGEGPGEANVIANNTRNGVFVLANANTADAKTTISANSIYNNASMGINLSPVGVNPNDPGDFDIGANQQQNFPVLTSASSLAGTTNVQGTLNSMPSTTFRVELFASASADPSGYGEGQTYLGATSVMTDVNGDGSFNVNLPVAVPTGQVISATATDPDGNTSEFSAVMQLLAGNTAPVASPDAYTIAEGGTLTTTDATGTATPGVTADNGVLANDSDVNGDALTAILVTGPAHAASFLLNAIGTFTYVHDGSETTSDSFTYEANDGQANSNIVTVAFTITPQNDPPSFTSPPHLSGVQDAPYSYAISTADPDIGDTRTISAVTLPAWLTLVDHGNGTATLSGTPTNAQVGNQAVALKVTDAAGASATQSFTIVVANTNDPPLFTSAPVTSATEDAAYSYAVLTGDPDVGDTRTITATTHPAWLTVVDHANGTATLSGTPTNTDVGNNSVVLKVTDAAGASATQSFTVVVERLEDRVIGVFELDGNTTTGVVGSSGSTTTSHDWDQVFADNNTAPPPISGARASVFVTDTVNSNADDIFTGGGSKDTQGIQQGQWLFTGSKPQGKNDIIHAYAATYTDPSNSHLIAYAGMDRFDNSGDATAGFWFFRNPVGENPGMSINGGHPFTGAHTDGDVLLVSDFTQGGSVSSIKVFRWTGDDSTGSLVALNSGNPIDGDTFAIVNGAPISVPWSYTNKSGQHQPAAGEFLEEGVDLTALGLDNSFSSFLAETRSSQSPTATLSDFVIGNFPQASESVAATPFVSLSAVGQSVTYPLTVTNTGAATLYLHNVSDTLLGNIVVNGVVQAQVAPVTSIDASGLSSDGSLAPNATVTIFVTRTVQATDPNPTLNTVTFVFNDRSDLGGAEVTASVTDRVDLATFSGFPGFLTLTGGVSNQGIANALTAKVTNALADFDAGHYSAAKGILGAFIKQVQAQRGKFITNTAADLLLEYASLLQEQLP